MRFAIILALVLIICLIWRTEIQKQRINQMYFFLLRTLEEMEIMGEKINELEERNK